MTKLLNSYTFLTKKTVYYSVTVGAENVNEAEQIASDSDYIGEQDDVQLLEQFDYDVVQELEQDEYEVLELLEKDED